MIVIKDFVSFFTMSHDASCDNQRKLLVPRRLSAPKYRINCVFFTPLLLFPSNISKYLQVELIQHYSTETWHKSLSPSQHKRKTDLHLIWKIDCEPQKGNEEGVSYDVDSWFQYVLNVNEILHVNLRTNISNQLLLSVLMSPWMLLKVRQRLAKTHHRTFYNMHQRCHIRTLYMRVNYHTIRIGGCVRVLSQVQPISLIKFWQLLWFAIFKSVLVSGETGNKNELMHIRYEPLFIESSNHRRLYRIADAQDTVIKCDKQRQLLHLVPFSYV